MTKIRRHGKEWNIKIGKSGVGSSLWSGWTGLRRMGSSRDRERMRRGENVWGGIRRCAGQRRMARLTLLPLVRPLNHACGKKAISLCQLLIIQDTRD